MDTQKVANVIDLMAKTGLFFAKADGSYDVKEQQFIEKFLGKLSKYGEVGDLKDKLEGYLKASLTLEEIVADTNNLVDGFNKVEKAAILASIAGFIERVIKADGVKSEVEKENYKAWKEAVL